MPRNAGLFVALGVTQFRSNVSDAMGRGNELAHALLGGIDAHVTTDTWRNPTAIADCRPVRHWGIRNVRRRPEPGSRSSIPFIAELRAVERSSGRAREAAGQAALVPPLWQLSRDIGHVLVLVARWTLIVGDGRPLGDGNPIGL